MDTRTKSQSKTKYNLESFLQRINSDFPDLQFKNGQKAYWDPKSNTIFYNDNLPNPVWSILHELGHMKLAHNSYTFDIELLVMESDAWAESKKIASSYGITMDNDYVEDCLDSYRDWLYKRSSCPKCDQTGLQSDKKTYNCINCRNVWHVTASRFYRPYRLNLKS